MAKGCRKIMDKAATFRHERPSTGSSKQVNNKQMGGIVLFIVVAYIITVIFNFFLRKQILDSGPIDDNAREFLKSLAPLGLEPLKWGLLGLFGGIGLVIIEFIPYRLNESPLPYGVEAIFLSIGFLTYYAIVRKQKP